MTTQPKTPGEHVGTDQEFIEYVADQANLNDRLSYKRMFGEYGIYVDGKFVALACDNSLFIKPSPAVEELRLDLPARPPYPRGKPHPVIDELLDDPARLRTLLVKTASLMPEPRSRGKSKRKADKP